MAKNEKGGAGLRVVASGEPADGKGKPGVLRKSDLVDRLVIATGAKKNLVKQITDAVLVEIGAALDKGEELALPPLGRIRMVKRKDTGSGEILTVRLRRLSEVPANKAGKPAAKEDEGLADESDDS
jgi:nucleoid DNA-binding protein